MIDRKISIVTMGLIFGVLPITYQILRILFATISDHFGRRKFLLLNGITTAASSIVYYFAYTPVQFLAGKLTQVVEDSSIWAINRPLVMDHSKDKKYGLILLRVYDEIFSAVGILISGFLISYLLFSNTLLFVFVIGLLIIPLSFVVKEENNTEGSFKKAFSFLNFLNRTSTFKKFMIFYFIMGLSDGFSTAYIFPLFLSQKLFSPDLIGFILGIQTVITGVFIFLFRKISLKKAMILGLSYPILLFILPIFSDVPLALLVLIIGIPGGLIIGASEGVVGLVSKKKSYGSDSGILFLGYNLARTINLSLSGLLISLYGFFTLFSLSSILFVVCTLYGLRNLKG
jgi:MFS family permease